MTRFFLDTRPVRVPPPGFRQGDARVDFPEYVIKYSASRTAFNQGDFVGDVDLSGFCAALSFSWCRRILDSEKAAFDVLRKVLEALPPRERTLLRLHHLHGFTMDRLATMYGESRSGVARRVLQSRERLLKLLRAELAGRLKPDDAALDSLLGLVNSQLDLSLNRLME
ncbi:hypothetical protein HRD49_25980 [Corallococcus exiguus]|nr:hypothetical protein [Corallococcus exiguus]NRD65209.1 hypothetical protein [Corallococcus exiguus]RKH18524.1 hypothetical protein D7V77_34025 [Corallococcus sp. CA041A]